MCMREVYKILSYIIINVYPVLFHVYCSACMLVGWLVGWLVVLFIFHYSCVFYLTVSSLTCCFLFVCFSCCSTSFFFLFCFGCTCIPRSSVKTKYERTITITKQNNKKRQNLWTRITFQYAYINEHCFLHTYSQYPYS